jgi:hypothetical protein
MNLYIPTVFSFRIPTNFRQKKTHQVKGNKDVDLFSFFSRLGRNLERKVAKWSDENAKAESNLLFLPSQTDPT